MILTENIQKSIGRFVLNRNYKKLSRKRSITNLNAAERVGVVFSPRNKDDLKTVKRFLAYLTNLDIKVFPLAFVDIKNSDIEAVLEQNINFVNKKDFNWYCKPINQTVIDFMEQDFDILINLSMEISLQIEFVLSLSKAKLKTGKFVENKETYCDLMIDIKESKDMNVLIEQTSHYLSMINSAK